MYTTIRCKGILEYLTALNLLGGWWSQSDQCLTTRPDAATLAALTGGRIAEMSVRS